MRLMNGRLWVLALTILLFLNDPLFAQNTGVKVACIGNSVTFGYGLVNPAQDSYPAQLQVLLGHDYLVENFGHSGATLLKGGHNPYYKTPEYTRLIAYKPDIAIIHLGLNDTDPRDWPDHRQDFESDYAWLIESVRKSNPNVKIFICRLTPIFSGHPRFKSGTRDWYWQIQGLIPGIAKVNGTELIDLHEPLYNRPDLFADNLHPDKEGASIIAQTIYQHISGNFGGLKLPEVYTDNMVLQRGQPIPVYGKANPGDLVEVQFKGTSIQSKTDASGRWKVVFEASKAGGPFQLKVTTKDSVIVINSVLVGDVWLCAGQSNMYFPLKKSAGGNEAIATAAGNKNLHLYKLNLQAETDPVVWDSVTLAKANHLSFFSGSWKQSDAQSTADFSAVAYYFGRQLTKQENIPIGLIEVAVGGSPTESWIDRYTMENDDKLVDILTNWQKSDFEMQFCRDRAAVNLKNATNAKQRHTYEPCYNYEAAIEPLTHFPIKGVVWYQGESNTHNVELYGHLFKTLVNSWRQKWGEELPFYYAQLSSINRPSWPVFRDTQRKLRKRIPDVAMAVSSDLGDSLNVHPIQKREIGERLALLAERYTYKMPIKADGPSPTVAQKIGNQIDIHFSSAVQLKTKGGQLLIGFELINDKGQHLVCTGLLQKTHILLTVPPGEKITAIYYAMQPFTRANLINEAGLPASTFTMQLNEKMNLFY
jgi:sialate O-acetylesterase